MRITVIAVGKLRDAGLRAAVDEYAKRIRRYARWDEIELKDGPDVDVAERLGRAVPERSRVVALDVDGHSFASAELARFVGNAELSGEFGLAFVIAEATACPVTF